MVFWFQQSPKLMVLIIFHFPYSDVCLSLFLRVQKQKLTQRGGEIQNQVVEGISNWLRQSPEQQTIGIPVPGDQAGSPQFVLLMYLIKFSVVISTQRFLLLVMQSNLRKKIEVRVVNFTKLFFSRNQIHLVLYCVFISKEI